MRREEKVILASAIAGVIAWIVDAAVAAYIFREASFLGLLFHQIPGYVLFGRCVIFAIFIICGIIMSRVLARQRESEEKLRQAYDYASSIVETVQEPLIVLDAQHRVVSANRSFYRTFKTSRNETEGRLFFELGNGCWNIPKLRELLEKIIPENTSIENFEVEHDFPGIGKRVMLLNARRLYREANQAEMILLAIEDITEQKMARERINHLNAILRAIRSVNQLITREKEAGKLLAGACSNLVGTRGYLAAWIITTDEAVKLGTSRYGRGCRRHEGTAGARRVALLLRQGSRSTGCRYD